ncbi:uncharacterized protein LOC121673695 [Corvus kubaryi]|uniref:uncharacterized protein LOC121673695 n=1 Tax=Corvus kubaryi TaxID=68294 RepID=UPI001C0521D8|nr:uncharacterized protein LOC121673695 [Corvus kubaryi]
MNVKAEFSLNMSQGHFTWVSWGERGLARRVSLPPAFSPCGPASSLAVFPVRTVLSCPAALLPRGSSSPRPPRAALLPGGAAAAAAPDPESRSCSGSAPVATAAGSSRREGHAAGCCLEIAPARPGRQTHSSLRHTRSVCRADTDGARGTAANAVHDILNSPHRESTSKAKCKMLNLGWSNPKHKCRLDRDWIDGSLVKKDLGVLVDETLIVTWQRALTAPKAKRIVGIQSSVGSRVREGILRLYSDLFQRLDGDDVWLYLRNAVELSPVGARK